MVAEWQEQQKQKKNSFGALMIVIVVIFLIKIYHLAGFFAPFFALAGYDFIIVKMFVNKVKMQTVRDS